MNIYVADFHFETTIGGKKPFIRIVKDVVTIRIPNHHINKKSDFYERAMSGFSITELKSIARDKSGKPRAKVVYIKKIGETNGSQME